MSGDSRRDRQIYPGSSAIKYAFILEVSRGTDQTTGEAKAKVRLQRKITCQTTVNGCGPAVVTIKRVFLDLDDIFDGTPHTFSVRVVYFQIKNCPKIAA